MSIQTFVFLDINTVGYSAKEKKETKITEITLIAVSCKDIVKANGKVLPPLGKLSLLINPQKDISSQIAKSTGLSTENLMNQPTFKDKVDTINSFLDLPKPVCLVTCKGNRFDYKILRSEYDKAEKRLPDDLLCVDPMNWFTEMIENKNKNTSASSSGNDSLLDTSLNASGLQPASPSTPRNNNQGKRNSIDDLNDTFANMTTNTTPKKESYTIQKIYKALLNEDPSKSLRTDDTSLMLLQSVLAVKQDFLTWAEEKKRK